VRWKGSGWKEGSGENEGSGWKKGGGILCFPQKLDPDAPASDAKSLFHWVRGRCMPLKRMKRIQFL